MRYRIFCDNRGFEHGHKSYFAGWIDTIKEAKKTFKEYKSKFNGKMELHEFDGEKFNKKLLNK